MRQASSILRLLRGRTTSEEPASLGPVGTLVEGVLAEAIERRASDLHLDPTATGTRVRYRVDGFFEQGDPLPEGMHERIVARVKVLAGLTVYRRDQVQEGSIRRQGGIELRVSILPTVAGEKLAFRLFDPAARPFRLEDLGYHDGIASALARLADLRQGTVIVAGPSGSGKTTTLYAALERIRAQRGDYANLTSIEDPVEFALDGVHQVAVNRERGLAFAQGLAALLRQDPEVILVGEIRDRETAAIAIEAGLTGHLVLTSVHAGTVPEAVTRLLDLGIEPALVATSVKGVVAQRLVRRVCDRCAAPQAADALLGERLGVDPAGPWQRGRGCPECRGSGYRGRLPVAEAVELSRGLAMRLLGAAPDQSWSDALAGGKTLLDDALGRARSGQTSLDEVARVIDTEEVNP